VRVVVYGLPPFTYFVSESYAKGGLLNRKGQNVKYGVIGCGVVGGSIAEGFRRNNTEISVYDKVMEPYTQGFKEVIRCDLVFIAVPTPPGGYGYDLTNLIDVLVCLDSQAYTGVAVIVSTISPGDYHILNNLLLPLVNKKFPLAVSPEFLREKTAHDDFYYGSRVFYGIESEDHGHDATVRAALKACRHVRTNEPVRLSPDECYLIKTNNNVAAAIKLASANLVFLEALQRGLNETEAQEIVDTVFDAPNLSTPTMYHKVGNHEGTLGFGGMCLSKDLLAKANAHGNSPLGKYLRATHEFNEYLRTLTVSKEHQ
jgi:UDP-glucose 6-dehydrogenase